MEPHGRRVIAGYTAKLKGVSFRFSHRDVLEPFGRVPHYANKSTRLSALICVEFFLLSRSRVRVVLVREGARRSDVHEREGEDGILESHPDVSAVSCDSRPLLRFHWFFSYV